jgi:hypothetical protein
VPRSFLRRLVAEWTAGGVRFHAVDDLLVQALGVRMPKGLDRSIRYLVHPTDRHALAIARSLGAAVAMASSRAAVCTTAAGGTSVVIVFPLDPLHHLFEKPALDPIDAALYFALQGDDAAERRFLAVVRAHALRRPDLEGRFAKAYGAAAPLPTREWLLRSTFDPELARARLASVSTA